MYLQYSSFTVSPSRYISLGSLLPCTLAAPTATTASSTTPTAMWWPREAFCCDQVVCVAPKKRLLCVKTPERVSE